MAWNTLRLSLLQNLWGFPVRPSGDGGKAGKYLQGIDFVMGSFFLQHAKQPRFASLPIESSQPPRSIEINSIFSNERTTDEIDQAEREIHAPEVAWKIGCAISRGTVCQNLGDV
jgi:hypothetical protein